GPIELLLSEAAKLHFGPYAWLLSLTMYSLTLSLVVLLARPRLVIYNACSLAEFRPVMAAVIDELDSQARWAGSSLSLPQLQVELNVESNPLLRSIVLVAAHDHQDIAGWRRLHATLARHLKTVTHRPNPWGVGLMFLAVVMLAGMARLLVDRPEQV